MRTELIKYLQSFVTDRRNELFNEVISWRTRYLTIVLENIYQPHNASAVLRTCDCFGIHDIHIIENSNLYEVNPDVALGSNKWLNLKKYNSTENNTQTAITQLKKNGYRIIATTPHTKDIRLDDFDIAKGKSALLFGTEMNGLSEKAMDMADEFIKIPMFGFTESYNISVSAAIILSTLTKKLRADDSIDWQLNTKEKECVLLDWYKSSINNSEGIINKYQSAITD